MVGDSKPGIKSDEFQSKLEKERKKKKKWSFGFATQWKTCKTLKRQSITNKVGKVFEPLPIGSSALSFKKTECQPLATFVIYYMRSMSL